MRVALATVLALVSVACNGPAARRVGRTVELGVIAGDVDLVGAAGASRADGDIFAGTLSFRPLEALAPEPVPMRDLERQERMATVFSSSLHAQLDAAEASRSSAQELSRRLAALEVSLASLAASLQERVAEEPEPPQEPAAQPEPAEEPEVEPAPAEVEDMVLGIPRPIFEDLSTVAIVLLLALSSAVGVKTGRISTKRTLLVGKKRART